MTTDAPAGDTRQIKLVVAGQQVMEGAGVRLRRIIGSVALDYVDPFLLLDEFKSDDPQDYIAGFPWHPHRGIETVTYMINGRVRHEDSLGNAGVVGPGDAQWMTAGHGIIHQEMPEQLDGLLWGFQLWVNLPASRKLCRPRYQDVTAASIPEQPLPGGGGVRVVAGTFDGVAGPIRGVAADPTYLDVRLPAGGSLRHSLPTEHSAFCYVYAGQGRFGGTPAQPGRAVASGNLVLLDRGELLEVSAGGDEVRFLLAAGQPLHEPVARGGPFVMNTHREIEQAYRDYRDGNLLLKD